jgi:hypothetical protein
MEATATFDWGKELEATVIKSLATSFGLDFLLFEDKKGGTVDTIHNVRKDIFATQNEKERYDNRGDYNSAQYHQHSSYIEQGKIDKEKQLGGVLYDHYRNKTMAINEKRDLDHVISAKEIHDDKGRVLAELDGVTLANQKSNLSSTSSTINRSKKDKPAAVFIEGLEQNIAKQRVNLLQKEETLSRMPKETPEQQHKYHQLQDEIRKNKEKITTLETVDTQDLMKKDEAARRAYDKAIEKEYYTSSKFIGNTANQAVASGFKMGTRQMLGLIMAEIWFELREQTPTILDKHKSNFQLDEFLVSIRTTMTNIWERLKSRFNDFLIAFQDGVFSGALSSVTTTLFNIFATSEKMVVKMIREMWSYLVQALKLIVFNPQNLNSVALMRAVANIISVGVATLMGTMIYTHLVPLLNFPFGAELAGFISAFATGIITLSFQYFLNYSDVMKKVWHFLESIENSSHAKTLEQFKRINVQLDKYLTELANLEFSFSSYELQEFSISLAKCNTEIEKSFVLRNEIQRRDIELPFEMGNSNSTRAWLTNLGK